MQAPSPAAQPPMEFEAALTRLAGGMPRLSADAYLQEIESKVNRLVSTFLMSAKDYRQADNQSVLMMTVHACRSRMQQNCPSPPYSQQDKLHSYNLRLSKR